MLCMLSQHHATGLLTDCMMTVLATMVEAAQTPMCTPYGPRLRVASLITIIHRLHASGTGAFAVEEALTAF